MDDRFMILDRDRMAAMLKLHTWFGMHGNEPRAESMMAAVFHQSGAVLFPVDFQQQAEDALMADGPNQLTRPEAWFVYDNVYRMIHEFLFCRVLEQGEHACLDDNDVPIPRDKFVRPARCYE